MTISYPHNPPSTPTAKGIKFTPRFAVASTESVFTYHQQVYEYQGQSWQLSVELPPMRRETAEAWIAWGLALNGSVGTFLYGDPTGATPRGTGGGTPKVDGAGQQRSKTLDTKGWTSGALVLKAGDYIQIGNRLHKVLADVTAAGDGTATVDVFPRIRDELVDEATITISNTKGLFRLAEPMSWTVGEAVIYGLSFEAVEAL